MNFFDQLFGPGQNEDQNDFRRQIGMQLAQPRTASPVGALSALIGGSLVGQANRQSDKFTAEAKQKQEDFRKLLGESLAGGDTTKIMQALVSSDDPQMMSMGVKLALEQAGGAELMNSGGQPIYNPKTGEWIVPPKAEEPPKLTRGKPGDVFFGPDGKEAFRVPGGGVTGKPSFIKAGLAPAQPKPSDVAKADAQKAKADARAQGVASRAQLVMDKVDEAIATMDAAFLPTTGLMGSLAGKVAGTNAYDLRGTIDTIKANIGFQELQAMRESSPTGGALGQVAVRELDFLQAVIASLDADQGDEVVRRNLQQVKKHYENWKAAVTQSRGGMASGAQAEIGGEGWSVEEVP